MLFSFLASILALVVASSAAPRKWDWKKEPFGKAYADVTSCVFNATWLDSEPDSPLYQEYYIGTIMQYYSSNGREVTITSNLTEVNTNRPWRDSLAIHSINRGGSPEFSFVGTWQPTIFEPSPKLYIGNYHIQNPLERWVELSSPTEHYQKSTVEAKDNGFQTLCLRTWSVDTAKAIASQPDTSINNVEYCSDSLSCPVFHSQARGYWNLPYWQ